MRERSLNPPLGSEYLPPETVELQPTVSEFIDVVKKSNFEPRNLDFDNIKPEADENSDKSLTQCYINKLAQTLEDKPNGRLYVDSESTADSLGGKLQQCLLSRTSIAETSAHQVFFTTLAGSGGRVRAAVKPFTEGKNGLLAEWTNAQLAEQKGFGVFKPLGFVTTSEGGYMLTERRDDVEPLDNAVWAGMLMNPEAHEGALNDLKQTGSLLARLHDDGGKHGDPQIKNFVGTEDGDICIIDWESAAFSDKPIWGQVTPEREEKIRVKVERDLKVIFGSLARSVEDKGVGFLDGMKHDAQWYYFKEYVLNPYIETRMQLIDEGAHPSPEDALLHLTEIETSMEAYVLNGKLYDSLARTRQRIKASIAV